MKKLISVLALTGAVALVLTGCASGGGSASSSGGAADGSPIKVGFSQVGAESGWRSANTTSLKDAFADSKGFKLTFSDAQQKQENQIAAIRSFITQGVGAIVFAPVVETGWDDVLKEAKDANIPVILEDRSVDSDASLYTTRVGDDFEKEGETAGKWVADTFNGKSANLVVLEGTTGSSAANDRTTGFNKAIAGSDVKVLDS